MEIFSQELIGAIMIGVMLFAIFIGFPISFTLIFLGLVFGYWGFGKLVFFSNDFAVQYDYDRKHAGCCPTLYFYGDINGICRSYGKTIFSYTINAI